MQSFFENIISMDAIQGLSTKVLELLAFYGLKVIAAVIVFVVGRWASRVVSNIIRRVMAKSDVDATIVCFVVNLIYFALLTFVVLAALAQLGIQTTSFIAIIGAAGLAVDVLERVKKCFDAEGINIPFPQQDVHLYEHKD